MVRELVEIAGIGNISLERTEAAERAVVCLHGLGQSSVMWEDTIKRLPSGWQGFALDMIGFGGSEKLGGGYSIELQARVVAQFIDELPHETVVLAANSIGGVVALTTVIEHSELDLAGLILVSSGAKVGNKPGAEAYRDKLRGLTMTPEVARTTVRGFTFHELGDEMWTRVAEAMVQADHPALHETLTSSIGTDLEARLEEIAIPTLIIQGMEDTARTPEDGLVIARRVQDGRLVVVPEAGHTPMLEVPDEFQLWFNAMLNSLES